MKKIIKRIIGKILPTFIIKHSFLFNDVWYEKTYGIKKENAAKHFLQEGYKNGCDPSIMFSCNDYLNRYKDVINYNPLLHYEIFGKSEGRIGIKEYKPIIDNLPNNEYNTNFNLSIITKFNSITIDSLIDVYSTLGATIYCNNIKDNTRYVAVFANEMTLTGAPIALLQMIKQIKNNGYNPIVFSKKDGPLTNDCIENNFNLIVYDKIYYDTTIMKYLNLFEFAVINTCEESVNLINMFNGKNIPIIWWIHESNSLYNDEILRKLPKCLFDNIKVYCVGEKSKNVLQTIRPLYKINILLYMLPECIEFKNKIKKENDKKVFVLIGTLIPIKGQNILLDSIDKMDDEHRKKCIFYFVGFDFNKEIYNLIKTYEKRYPENIKYLGLLSRSKLEELYSITDCLICPSIYDTMPIVVSEAWQREIFTICSTNIGQASFIKNENCGFIYEDNDSEKLLEKIYMFIDNKFDCNTYIKKAKNVFNNNFTEQQFANQVKNIINSIKIKKKFTGMVSVIIPVYNGKDDIKNLLRILNKQKEIKVEIICIDSGSNQETLEIINKNNCKVINIKNEEFSHSYARNLGAKSATGEYLLFMTQDALPEDEYWLRDFVNLTYNSDIDVSTCKQEFKEEHDLYGKLETWNRNVNIGYDRYNIISTWDDTYIDFNIMKSHAALSDAVCLIKKEIFEKYKYRGVYGEDLDLGIRLIKDNYKIGFLSDVHIKHSHCRKQYYNLKRGMVEGNFEQWIYKANKYKNIPIYQYNKEDYILSLYLFSIMLVNNIKEYNKSYIYDLESYMSFINERINYTLNEIKSNNNLKFYNIFVIKNEKVENEIYNLLFDLFCEKQYSWSLNMEIINQMIMILTNNLKQFFKYNYYSLKSDMIIQEIIEFIINKMAFLIGFGITSKTKCNSSCKSKTLLDFKNKVEKKYGI